MVLQPYQGHLAFDRAGTPLWRCGIWPAKGLALEAVARQLGFTIEQVALQGFYEALVTVGGARVVIRRLLRWPLVFVLSLALTVLLFVYMLVSLPGMVADTMKRSGR